MCVCVCIFPTFTILFPSNPGLLLTAQLHNAHQLSGWCLHFISSNFVAFKDKQEFSLLLTGDNLDHVTSHRWPPLSYEQAMEEYRKKYLEEEDSEAESSDSCEECKGVTGEAGEGVTRSKTVSGRHLKKSRTGNGSRTAASGRCKVM